MTAKQQPQMEWSSHVAEDKYFIRICLVTLFIFIVLSISIPLVNIPPIEKSTVKPIPQRFAKLILEKKKIIEKPKKKELTAAEKAALKKAEEERRKRLEEERKKREAERKKREEELKKKREEDRKKAEAERKKREAELKKKREEDRKKSEAERKKAEAERKRQEAARKKAEIERQRQEIARKKAEAEQQRKEETRRRAEAERKRIAAEKRRIAEEKKKGEALAASLFGDLADLPNEPVTSISGNNALIAKTERGTTAKTLSSPNVLTSKTAGTRQGSGGIDAAKMGQLDIGAGIDVALENRATTILEEVDLGVLDGSDNDASTVTASGQPIRSKRELNTALERKKGRIYKIYQRALRKDPTLGGKVVLKLTILPTGDVESVEIVSSDIDVDSFLRKLKTLIKSIKFPDRDVSTVVVNYPIDFGAL
ncbi:Serine/threonine protein phosphatase [hydrothermal vent metagenome]|uniref:Serine/threonine protein phosphatase n=1 Tax=hydrothermal vent metagenome TaxID=652676 RepID=A0A3B0YTI7_9ZZZZ